MKKIAFFVQHMLCGGVENALISLSNELIKLGNDVTIYVIREYGDFMCKIPKNVHCNKIPMDEKIRNGIAVGGTKITVGECLNNRKYLSAIQHLTKHFIGKNKFAELSVDFDKIPNLDQKYDIAVNYHMHSPFLVKYLSEKVMADRKLTWMHNDFSTTGYKVNELKKYLDFCEHFYGVSQKIVSEFTDMIPEYKEKTSVSLNIVPSDQILKKADEFMPIEYEDVPTGYLKLLSVGRLEEQKGFDITVDVCKKLLESGYGFKWFILGEGSQRKQLEKDIKKYGLEDTLLLLGVKMNPYPYFKNCDIYVQTSKHEGWGLTLTEAKIFSCPIVTTDFAGAREQLMDGVSGDIVDIDASSVLHKLERLIKEPERREKYSKKLTEEVIAEDPEWISVFG